MSEVYKAAMVHDEQNMQGYSLNNDIGCCLLNLDDRTQQRM